MSQTHACSKCKELKPYPESFITSYKKNTIGGTCKDCRIKCTRQHHAAARIKSNY